jgi:hypothetical protein
MRDFTEDELHAIAKSADAFSREKAGHKLTTGYGLKYSPCYLRQGRSPKA